MLSLVRFNANPNPSARAGGASQSVAVPVKKGYEGAGSPRLDVFGSIHSGAGSRPESYRGSSEQGTELPSSPRISAKGHVPTNCV